MPVLSHPTPRWECTRITCPYLPARVGLFALFRRLITEQTVQTPQYGGQNDPITPYIAGEEIAMPLISTRQPLIQTFPGGPRTLYARVTQRRPCEPRLRFPPPPERRTEDCLPQFIETWSLTNTQAGWLAGIMSAGYMLAVVPLVSLTDRQPARHIYLASSALSALSCFGIALCDSPLPALAFRAAAGITLAGMYMPGLQALTACGVGEALLFSPES